MFNSNEIRLPDIHSYDIEPYWRVQLWMRLKNWNVLVLKTYEINMTPPTPSVWTLHLPHFHCRLLSSVSEGIEPRTDTRTHSWNHRNPQSAASHQSSHWFPRLLSDINWGCFHFRLWHYRVYLHWQHEWLYAKCTVIIYLSKTVYIYTWCLV